MSDERTELAQTAYAAYGQSTGGLNHRGEPMPAWDNLGARIQEAWRAAAGAIGFSSSRPTAIAAPQPPPPPQLAKSMPPPLPGHYGVSHGGGMVGELIRHATESWAGHAFVYVGNGMIIEAAPPATRLAPIQSHPDAVWNSEEPITDAQSARICARAHALLGTPYDYAAYVGFALETLKIASGKELNPVFKRDSWRVCSADVADEYGYSGIDVTQGARVPNLVSPADLYDRVARQLWKLRPDLQH